MALVIEDGSGKADADSYVSLADASTIATALGLTFAISGADEALAEQALRRASLWMDATYRAYLGGWRTKYRAQAFEFPRSGMWDAGAMPQIIAADEIPVEWKKATVIAAVREKASPGTLSPDVAPGKVKKSATVGDISVEYAIGSGSVTDQRSVVTMIDDVLGSLLAINRGAVLFGKAVRG